MNKSTRPSFALLSARALMPSACAAALATGLTALPTAAIAQQGSSFALEEIVVTSRRREESLQDVPLAVNAFGATAIERAGIDRPNDFIELIPNVQFIQTTNVGESQVHIRGIIQPRDSEPPFAYVLDGVLVPNANAFNQELVDIEQIEVIKGPIGSIYGRNAIGGAILVKTRKPTNDVEVMARGGYEFEGKEVNLSGFVSGPIVEDKLFARVTAAYKDRSGYYENVTRNEKEDPFEEMLMRGRLIFQATDRLTLDASLGYSKIEGHAFNFNNQTAGTPGFETGVDIDDTSIPNAGNIRSFNNQERLDASLRMEWDTDMGTLSAFVAYHDIKEDMGGEGAVDIALFGLVPEVDPTSFFIDPSLFEGYGPTPRDGTQYQQRNQDDISAEIRFTSPDDHDLRYIVGAYFIDFNREVLLNTGLDFGPDTVLRNPVSGVDTINPTNTLLWADNRNKAYALFGQLAYDVTPDLEVALALRWDREERKNVNLVPDITSPASIILGNPAPLTLFPGAERSDNFSDLQPRISVRYTPAEEFALYASYGEGFRSGGFNPLGSRDAIINVDGVTNTTVQDEFGKETSKSAEIGVKSELMDNRVRVNAAVFYTKVSDAHFFQFFPFSLARVISIVDKNEIWGFEADVAARIAEGLDLFGGFGYLSSEIKANSEAPETVGNTMPFTPGYSLNLGAQYSHPVASDMEVITRVDYNRTGRMFYDTLNTPGTRRSAVDIVNARISLDAPNWAVTLWSRNLFNKKYNTDGVVLVVPDVTVFNFVTKAAPRTVGVDFKVRF
ncbi:MAG: TonB-dependent receptor [Sphingomonadales bacterium]